MSSLATDECVELKNIKYKTMLLNGNPITEYKSSNDLVNLDKFLEDDKTNNQNEPWTKLDKMVKIKKIIIFAEKYSKEKNYSGEEEKLLILFLKDCIDRKKIYRVKDVDYDKIKGEIKDIPALFFNKVNKNFTLKNIDKRVSTLKSLPPKKVRGTIKNIKIVDSDESSDNDTN